MIFSQCFQIWTSNTSPLSFLMAFQKCTFRAWWILLSHSFLGLELLSDKSSVSRSSMLFTISSKFKLTWLLWIQTFDELVHFIHHRNITFVEELLYIDIIWPINMRNRSVKYTYAGLTLSSKTWSNPIITLTASRNSCNERRFLLIKEFWCVQGRSIKLNNTGMILRNRLLVNDNISLLFIFFILLRLLFLWCFFLWLRYNLHFFPSIQHFSALLLLFFSF